MKKRGVRKTLKIIGIVLLSLFAVYGVFFLINIGCNIALRNYIKSFDVVDYGSQNRITPVIENGHYTWKTDDELEIMHFTDIHIGGGFWTYKKDKKTIYEVITMLQAQKPDMAFIGGDSVFAVPGPMFNGGFTFNNAMVSKTVMKIFDHEGVYYVAVFGNHDTEAFDYTDRTSLGKKYMKYKSEYNLCRFEYTDPDADTVPSVTNQIMLVKGNDGKIVKVLVFLDTNAYKTTHISSSINWDYDVVHDAQIEWLSNEIKSLSKAEGLPDGEYLKSMFFAHIPIGEYRTALDDLIEEVKDGDNVTYISRENPEFTEFISGGWGEDVCYGGYHNEGEAKDQDRLFEVMAEDMNSMEAFFCGHDHINNAVVKYKGVTLSYGNSLDNIAYTGIAGYGLQRGATVITVKTDGNFEIEHKNAYREYKCDPDKFLHVDLTQEKDPDHYRTYIKK